MLSFSYVLTLLAAFFTGAAATISGFLLMVAIAGSIFLPTEKKTVSYSVSLPDTFINTPAWIKQEASIAEAIRAYFPYTKKHNQIAYWIVSAANTYKVNPVLLTSVIAKESSFRTDAMSSVGAIGLGQVIPHYWESACGLDVSIPENNVWCAAYALKIYMKRYGSKATALAVYNVGPHNYKQRPRYKTAGIRYASAVMAYQDTFGQRVKGEHFSF